MTDRSEQVAAELYQIWVGGKILLPEVATDYAQANRGVHNTNFYAHAFKSIPKVEPAWNAIRDLVQNIFGDTSQNLALTGAGLIQVVEAFKHVDGANDQLLESINERLESAELDQPPPEPPPVKRPGDEVDTEVVVEGPGLLPDIRKPV